MNFEFITLQYIQRLSSSIFIGYWVSAIVFYLVLRFIVPEGRVFMEYGKLSSVQDQTLSISHSTGFTLFYIFGALLNSFAGIFMYYLRIQSSFWVVWALLEFHFLRRIFECFFVHVWSPKRMVALNMLAGLSFYSAIVGTVGLSPFAEESPQTNSHCSYKSIVLFGLFFFGSCLQSFAHWHLAGLRRNTQKRLKYSLPRALPFRIVSCPHYFAELILYFVFAHTVNSPASWLMAVFVCLNLTDRALLSQEWYCKKFSAPPAPYALLPFVL